MVNETCTSFANRLRTLIDATGLSAYAFSRATGIKYPNIGSYLNGRSIPSAETLIILSNYFGVSVDYLLGLCDENIEKEIEKNYSTYFMQMRRAPYEAYLVGRIPMSPIEGFESPWPYNLLDAIISMPGKEQQWETVVNDDQMDGLKEAMKSLTEREYSCVFLYYKDGKTFDHIGSEFGITRERARQIIVKAIRKLRHPSRLNIIRYGTELVEKSYELHKRRVELEKEQAELDAWEQQLDLAKRKADLEAQQRELEVMQSEHATECASAFVPQSILNTPVETLDLSARCYNCLYKRAGCKTLADVIKIVRTGEILDIRNFGQKCLNEVLDKTEEMTGIRERVGPRKIV